MRDRIHANRWKSLAASLAAVAFLPLVPQAGFASDFEDDLERVDRALRENPSHVPALALRSCRSRRTAAIRYEKAGNHAQAESALKYCLRVLKVPEPER